MLKKNYEFKKVLTKGKYFSGNYIESFILKNNKAILSLGIAISKKTGNSVCRNKIKRLIRENYRLLEENFNTGFEVVILWKKKASLDNATFINIKEDIVKIFKNADILQQGEI